MREWAACHSQGGQLPPPTPPPTCYPRTRPTHLPRPPALTPPYIAARDNLVEERQHLAEQLAGLQAERRRSEELARACRSRPNSRLPWGGRGGQRG